jgi:phenolic acid decarboxylase
MRNQFSKIVVANTFTQEWEMEPYFTMAERYNYRIHSVIVENRHGNKNVHNVPDEKILAMTNRFEIKL